jgi:hypothetical protein
VTDEIPDVAMRDLREAALDLQRASEAMDRAVARMLRAADSIKAERTRAQDAQARERILSVFATRTPEPER